MERKHQLSIRGFVGVWGLAAWLACAPAGRGQNAGDELPARSAPAQVVLRVSAAMLNSALENKLYDQNTDVRDTILGTAVTGKARIVGQPRVRLTPSADRAAFDIVFEGTVGSRTTGVNGPAILKSRTETRFTAIRQIVFEPGKGYSALPAKVSTSIQVIPEGIDTTRGGLIGFFIRRRAARLEQARRPEATEIVRQKTERRILAAFDRTTQEQLARLNDNSRLQSVAELAMRLVGKENPTYACCTSPQFLQIVAHFGEPGPESLELPSEMGSVLPSLAELWLPNSLLNPAAAATLKALESPGKAGELLAELLADSPAGGGGSAELSPLATLLEKHPVRVQPSGPWRVVALGPSDEASRLAAGPRLWTSGKFTAEAEFLALDAGTVRLRRVTGVKTSIPLEKLSAPDRAWIAAHLAGK